MSTLPGAARVVVIGAGIVGNSLVLPPRPPGLARHRPDRQGRAAEPGRLDRPRLELHLPDRPLAGDDRADRRQRRPVQGDGRLHPERRHRGRPDRASGWTSSSGGWRRRARGASTPSWSTRPRSSGWSRTSNTVIVLGGFSTPGVGVVDSLRAGTIMRERAQASGALTLVADDRGHRHRRRRRPRHARPDRPRRHRGRDRRHRLRRVEPAHRRRWPARPSRSRRRSTR